MGKCQHEKFVRVFGQHYEGNYDTEKFKDVCLNCGKSNGEIKAEQERDALQSLFTDHGPQGRMFTNEQAVFYRAERAELQAQVVVLREALEKVRNNQNLWRAALVSGCDKYQGLPPMCRIIDEALTATPTKDAEREQKLVDALEYYANASHISATCLLTTTMKAKRLAKLLPIGNDNGNKVLGWQPRAGCHFILGGAKS